MRTRIRFYLDEHLAHAIAEALRRRGIDVATVAEVERRGATDEDQLEWATREHRVLVSRDPDFIALHSQQPDHAGIVYVPRTTVVRAVLKGLLLIHEVLDADEMLGRLEYLPRFDH